MFLDPWQQSVLHDSLAERADGRWAALEIGLIVPRQNGKGSILEARELAGLFLFGERLILHSAHEFKTASEAFLRINTLIDGCSDLSKRVRKVYTAHGQEGIELLSGQRLKFVARSKGSGRGFSGDTVILDEAYNLSDKAVSALMPTLSARQNPQVWYTSSAPLPSEDSDVLRRLCKRGRKGSERLAYLEWCAEDDPDLDDTDAVIAANPSFGVRVNEEFIATERGAMTDDDYARERLGIWREDSVDAVIPITKWDICADDGSKIVGKRCFAFDVTPDSSHASIAVCGNRADGLPHIEVIAAERGTRWLPKRLDELAAKWKPSKILCDPASPAGSLLPDITAEIEEVTMREHAHACTALLTAILDEQIRHPGQLPMRAAVLGAGRRNVGDVWLWSRSASTADISPLIAATLAAWGQMPKQAKSVPLVAFR